MKTATDDEQSAVQELVGRALVGAGGLWTSALIATGDRLGLFRALADGESRTPQALARETGMTERGVHDWLSAMAARGFLTCVRNGHSYRMSPEQQGLFADDASPLLVVGAFEAARDETEAGPRLDCEWTGR
ncbi:MAG: hypothetical protein AB7O67_21895 [Vicinamibacterales bacterium]